MSVKKIIIADDHVIFREGLKQVISSTENMVVTDEASIGSGVMCS